MLVDGENEQMSGCYVLSSLTVWSTGVENESVAQSCSTCTNLRLSTELSLAILKALPRSKRFKLNALLCLGGQKQKTQLQSAFQALFPPSDAEECEEQELQLRQDWFCWD